MLFQRLFNRSRYEQCARLFHRPLWSHLAISAALPFPLTLKLLDGDKLRVPNARGCRRMFDLLLEELPDPFPVTVSDGLVEFHYDGLRYALRASYADFYIFKEVIVRDDYRLNDLPQSLGTVVDLGTNIGLFSLKMAAKADRVVSLEPVRANFELARHTLELAGLAHKVKLRKAAVAGQSSGTIRIYASNENSGGHSVFRNHARQWGGVEFEDVPAISLADLFAEERIERCSLLKCDVEGAEFDVIANTPLDLLSTIDRILMEVHLNVIDYDLRRLSDFTGRLAAAGFRVEHDSLTGRWGRRKRGIMLWATQEQAAARRAA
jgi:FkbM family methyltransferase